MEYEADTILDEQPSSLEDCIVVRAGYPNLKESVKILEEDSSKLVIFVFFIPVDHTYRKPAVERSVRWTDAKRQLNQIPSQWRRTVMDRVFSLAYPIDTAMSQSDIAKTLKSIHRSYSARIENNWTSPAGLQRGLL